MPVLMIWGFIKKHWRLIATLLAVLLVFFLGRASVHQEPAHVETKVFEKRVVDQALVEQEVEKRVKEMELKLAKKTTTRKITKPDGTKIETKVTELNVDKKEQQVETKQVEKVVTKTEYVDRVITKQVDAPKKDWIVGPLVGFNVRDIGIQNGAFQFGQVGVGLQVQRRVFDDFFIGASGLHTGAVNIGLSYQF
jgi:hypothetical protein